MPAAGLAEKAAARPGWPGPGWRISTRSRLDTGLDQVGETGVAITSPPGLVCRRSRGRPAAGPGGAGRRRVAATSWTRTTWAAPAARAKQQTGRRAEPARPRCPRGRPRLSPRKRLPAKRPGRTGRPSRSSSPRRASSSSVVPEGLAEADAGVRTTWDSMHTQFPRGPQPRPRASATLDRDVLIGEGPSASLEASPAYA